MEIGATLRRIRRFAKSAFGLDVAHRADVSVPTAWFGNAECGWVVCPRILGPHSVVYSFGVGRDISFDLELISSLKLDVHAFDPTPRSIDWINGQSLPSSFHFHALGIADFDGKATFNAPKNPEYVSYTMAPGEGNVNAAVHADVRRLKSIMTDLGHTSVDVLKLDVEGAEYDVLTDVLSSNLDIRQILVEFHHRFSAYSIDDTNQAVDRLRRSGYRLLHVSPNGEEYAFIRSDGVESAVS